MCAHNATAQVVYLACLAAVAVALTHATHEVLQSKPRTALATATKLSTVMNNTFHIKQY